MRYMGLDENLIQWTDSFMRDHRIIMSMGGQGNEARKVTTSLLQGSPIPPVLFAIYIAEIHEVLEQEVEGCRGISFADDVTWLAEGDNLSEVVQRLEK